MEDVPLIWGPGVELSFLNSKFSKGLGRLVAKFFHYTIGTGFWLFFKWVCKGNVEGEEHIRALKPVGFVVAANHSSYLDWLILYFYFLYVHETKVSFLAKEKVLNHKIWGPLVANADCIQVASGRGIDLRSKGHARLLEQDRIVIFPEGTRSPTGKIIKGKTGVARIAINRDLPVIPTALCGFFEAWPRHRIFPKPFPLSIKFGAPMSLVEENPPSRTAFQMQTDKIMDRIRFLKGEAG